MGGTAAAAAAGCGMKRSAAVKRNGPKEAIIDTSPTADTLIGYIDTKS